MSMMKGSMAVLAAAALVAGAIADQPPATLGVGDDQLAQVIDFAIAKVSFHCVNPSVVRLVYDRATRERVCGAGGGCSAPD